MSGPGDAIASVAVVDDHFLFAQSIARVIKAMPHFRVAGIAVTGPQALALAREEQPTVVLVDADLPGYGAEELVPRLRAASRGVKVLLLVDGHDAASRARAARAGADLMLGKDEALDDVLAAVAALARHDGARTALEAAPAEREGVARPAPSAAERPRQVEVPDRSAAPPPSEAVSAPPAPGAPGGGVLLRLSGVSSFAQVVLIERFIERAPGVEQAHVTDVTDGVATLRVTLGPGHRAEDLARSLLERSRTMRLGRSAPDLVELQLEGSLVNG